jgi:hypothetical protein
MDLLPKHDLLDETSTINEESKLHLTGIAQWANLYAIVSFVSLGLSFISIFVSYAKLSKYGYGATGSIVSTLGSVIVTTAISLLLNITLFNAAKFIKMGVLGNDQSAFAMGISKLNTYFKIYGILVIIMLVFFGLFLIAGLLIGASTGFNKF